MNVFRAIKAGKDFKIKFTTLFTAQNECRKVQEAVFDAGGSWHTGHVMLMRLSYPYLLCEGKMMKSLAGYEKDIYENSSLPEAFMTKKRERK